MKKERFGERLKNWIINNIIGILTIAWPIIVFLFKSVFLNNNKWTPLEQVLLLLIVLESIIILSKFLWNKFSYKSYIYPRSRISSNYIVLKKIVNYRVNEKGELFFSRTLEIKSKINHLESIFDKFIWTGNNRAEVPRPEKNVSTITEQPTIGIWRYIRVTLKDSLSKGEEREISYKWPKISDCTSSSPFVSTSTEEPTKQLIFKIKLGAKYSNREIRLEEFRAIEADNPISVKIVRLDNNGDYEWDVSNIKRFRHYRVRWSWELDNSPVPDLITKKEGKG